MRGYLISIIVLAVITSAKAVTFNDRNLRWEQFPQGPTLVLEGPKTKMTLRVYSNESQFEEVICLKVSLGVSIQGNKRTRAITVIYNSCTDSDDPEWSCKEVQITLRRGETFGSQQMSFDLYHSIKLVHHLTEIDLALQSPISHSTTNDTTSDTTSTTSEQPGSNTEPLRLSVPATLGVIAVLSLVIVVSIVLIVVLLYMCYRHLRTIKSLNAKLEAAGQKA